MYQTTGNYGWICPKCGQVHAPWVAQCYCPESKPYEIYSDPEPFVWVGTETGTISLAENDGSGDSDTK
jgi:hypothetical protein